MDKAIVTILLTIAGVVCAVFIFNGVYPAINRGNDSVVSMSGTMSDRIKSQVEIIQVTADTSPTGRDDVFVWVKNVGNSRILGIERSDVYFGEEGSFQRIPYTDEVGGGSNYPYWVKNIEGGTNEYEWKSSQTLKITIHYDSDLLTETTYFVKVIIPNGISDEEYFSIQAS